MHTPIRLFVLVLVLTAAMSTHTAAGDIQVRTLSGQQHDGQLVSLNRQLLRMTVDGQPLELKLDSVTGVRFLKPEKSPTKDAVLLSLTDGSRVSISEVRAAGENLTGSSGVYGNVRLPLKAVKSIRLGVESEYEKKWAEFCARENKRDLLVVRKKDGSGLDFTSGVVGGIDAERVTFVLSGQSIPVSRKRVFGVVFSRQPIEFDSPLARVTVGTTDLLLARSLQMTESRGKVSLLTKGTMNFPTSAIAAIDLSSDKIQYLSDMEPRSYQFEPFFLRDGTEEILYRYRRDTNRDGRPLRIGNKVYARGLYIHSKSTLTWRLDRKFRRLQAVMGIDQDVARRGLGTTDVTISGDNRVLFQEPVTWETDPIELDLDVSGVRELRILVDVGGDTNLSDWLDLADARVVK